MLPFPNSTAFLVKLTISLMTLGNLWLNEPKLKTSNRFPVGQEGELSQGNQY